jgi:hypothetical protein
MHTEDETKKKWCPMARVQQASEGNEPIGEPFNRQWKQEGLSGHHSIAIKATQCIASDCMMWRWNMDYESMTEEGHGGDVIIRLKRKANEPKMGYCGLAGRP